jgi:hypothetical protein
MSYKIAGIDVHKRILAVVVANVEIQDVYQFEQPIRRQPRASATTGGMAD